MSENNRSASERLKNYEDISINTITKSEFIKQSNEKLKTKKHFSVFDSGKYHPEKKTTRIELIVETGSPEHYRLLDILFKDVFAFTSTPENT